MFSKAINTTPVVPSRNVLRVLRHLALAGGTVGGFCTFAAVYDTHRRIRIAEQIIENKRTLRTSAPNYDATASARRISRMQEAAEAGEFLGLDSLKVRNSTKGGPGESSKQDTLGEEVVPAEDDVKSSLFGKHEIPVFNHLPHPNERSFAVNRIAMAYETKQGDALKAEGRRPLNEVLSGLLRKKEEIRAADLFLRHVVPQEGDGTVLSFERRAIARDIFAMNCLNGNTFIARAVFNRIHEVSLVDQDMWIALIHLLARGGHVESAAVVFDKYRTKYALPPYLLEVVMRCLIESQRLHTAKWLLLTRIHHDVGGGLCGAYLDAIWKKTRSVELLQREFEKVLAGLRQSERKPTSKVFNPLIKAYVFSGRFEEAQNLVTKMSEKLNIQPDCRGFGLLALARALQSDWDGVMSMFRNMHNKGYSKERSFISAFDRVFLEFYPTHQGPQILDFLVGAITEFDIQPDKVLHQHIIEAIVERGDNSALDTIQQMANDRNWRTFGEERIAEIIRERRLAMRDSPMSTWHMMQAAKKQARMVASSQRIQGAGVDLLSTPTATEMALINNPARETYGNTMETLVSKRPINLFIPLSKRLAHFIHSGQFSVAIDCFWQAVDKGYAIKPDQMQLAVIAILLKKGNSGIEDARHIIKTQWATWVNLPTPRKTPRFPIVMPLMFQKLKQVDRKSMHDITLMKIALFQFYEICAATSGLNVKNHATTTVARRLIEAGRCQDAIMIFTAVYMSKWRKMEGFGQVEFKMLIRAFALSNNSQGVWWCMLAVLCRPQPPAHHFITEVKNLMSYMEKHFDAASLRAIDRTLHALQEKRDRKGKWSNVLRYYSDRREVRSKLTSPSAAAVEMTSPLEDVVKVFDEEMEFDRLFERPHFTEKELRHWWREDHTFCLTRRQPEHPMYPCMDPMTLRK